MTGFTGVIWDARTPRRLADDLGAGPGAAPLHETAASWLRLADEFAGAAAEYASIVSRLREHWESGVAQPALDHLATFTGWLVVAAARATATAVTLGAQAAAVDAARLAMPDLGEIDLLASIADAALSVTALTPLATGAAAHAERAVHDQRMRAARVMEAYEAAGTPLCTRPPVAAPAPIVVSDTALIAERHPAPRPPVQEHHHPNTASASGAGALAAAMVPAVAVPRGNYHPVSPTSSPVAPVTTAPKVSGDALAPSAGLPPPVSPAAPTLGERATVRTVVDAETVPVAGDSAEVPQTWAEVAVAAGPAPASGAPDSRHMTQTVTLAEGSGR
ncbi:PPE domain-containing protein [Gordonia sp. NPDC003504]